MKYAYLDVVVPIRIAEECQKIDAVAFQEFVPTPPQENAANAGADNDSDSDGTLVMADGDADQWGWAE